MLAVAGVATAAATAAVLADEFRRRDGDQVTDSCLAAIEIDRAVSAPASKVSRLRTAGTRGELADGAPGLVPAALASPAEAVSQ